ncbi:YadA-like family protein [Cardiobacteriaceae bacterium TAE3-ERU3]|nr:YadA-like family protein [Cardiobacteriaceae bacterium TAE3-ERU3]
MNLTNNPYLLNYLSFAMKSASIGGLIFFLPLTALGLAGDGTGAASGVRVPLDKVCFLDKYDQRLICGKASIDIEAKNSIAIGNGAEITKNSQNSIAIGSATQSLGTDSIALGHGAQANGPHITAVGAYAGIHSNGVTNFGTFVGFQAGQGANGSDNVLIGHLAGESTKGTANISLGQQSGQQLHGDHNISIGYRSGESAQGSNNIAVGREAGVSTQGYNNIATGFYAGQRTNGEYNLAYGYASGKDVDGNYNIAQGLYAGQSVLGSANIADGVQAGTTVKGHRNIATGFRAGQEIEGNDNVSIGSNSGTSSGVINHSTSIGTSSQASVNTGVALGAYSHADRKALNDRSVKTSSGEIELNNSPDTVFVLPNATKTDIQSVIDTVKGDLAAVSVGSYDEATKTRKTRQITNLAAGSEDTDAVNVAQLRSAVGAIGSPSGGNTTIIYQNPVNITAGDNIEVIKTPSGNVTEFEIKTKPVVTYEQVNVGDTVINQQGIYAGDKKITGVADGRIAPNSSDAVNGGQLHDALSIVNGKIDNIDQKSKAGTASAVASANIPQIYLPGKSAIGVGLGTYEGEQAIAIGVSSISDNGKWIIKGSVNANSTGKGAGLGVSYMF